MSRPEKEMFGLIGIILLALLVVPLARIAVEAALPWIVPPYQQ